MNLSSVIFGDNLPKLDLHGYDRETARVAITDYVKENKFIKNSIFMIVHGVGTGILQKATHETLKHNKDVIEYKLNNYNSGCTLVKIRV